MIELPRRRFLITAGAVAAMLTAPKLFMPSAPAIIVRKAMWRVDSVIEQASKKTLWGGNLPIPVSRIDSEFVVQLTAIPPTDVPSLLNYDRALASMPKNNPSMIWYWDKDDQLASHQISNLRATTRMMTTVRVTAACAAKLYPHQYVQLADLELEA